MFKGSIVALVTPFRDGKLDKESLRELINWHIEEGATSLVIAGTTGESPCLGSSEYEELLKLSIDYSAQRALIIAGTGSNCTKATIEKTKLAKELGADACLIVTPYYNKPVQNGLYEHFKAINDAVDIPQILYNVPGRTAVDLGSDTVAKLSKLNNIIGIKDATGDISRLTEMKKLIEDSKFCFLSGDDATTLEFIKHGGQGSISVVANVAPGQMQKMCLLALDGKHEDAKLIDNILIELHKCLFVEPNPIPVKWALEHLGKIDGEIRLPLTRLDESKHALVIEALKISGAII